ncbi:acyloxyacyl hydrolase [Sinomicrobium sp.]
MSQDAINAPISQNSKASGRFVHHIAVEFRPAYILPTASFYRGENLKQKPIQTAWSGHLKYAFRFSDHSWGNRIYPNTYQGIGISHYGFDNPKELGKPWSIYLFQRSEIAKIGKGIALDYEWNFGISTGWKPHSFKHNPYNIAIGSSTNAYLNAGVYLRWKLGRYTNLATGIDFTHFSNGNTSFPNAGLNMTGLKIGLLHDFQKRNATVDVLPKQLPLTLEYPKHISYDLVLFGSWRRKGVETAGQLVPSPHRYPVLGMYFAPMYNLSRRFRTGISLDAVYDGSANVYAPNYFSASARQKFFKPPSDQQLAMGISARAEYIMPFFTMGIGLGSNLLHKGGDFRGTYQTFALKITTTRNSFLHIGYNLKDFHKPNYLMLGLGYRFNNKTPSLLH